MENAKLKAWFNNGTLYVSGLTPGKLWNVYNFYVQLIYSWLADGNEAKITLQERDVYIIQSGSQTNKTVY